jgi:hypothetical protein
MATEDRKIQLSRPVELSIGIVVTILSLSLVLLCVFILVGVAFSSQAESRQGVTLFSVPASFAIFFSVVARNLLKRKKDRVITELMSINSWRFLAGAMFGFGVIILFFGTWVGVLLPCVIGAISLLKDPKIRELYQAILGV